MNNDNVYVFLYCWMCNYMYLCTNKAKNITKITKNWAITDDVDHTQFSPLG